MVTKDSLELQYAKLETENLLVIIAVNSGYTELAVEVALAELKKRDVHVDEIELFQSAELNQYSPEVMQNYLDDLNFFQKLFFFIIWFRSLRPYFFKTNFQENGYILKSHQSSYYSVVGFASLIIAIASNYVGGFWLVWILCFFIAYAFDINYNKARQIKKLQEIMAEGGDFEWD